MKEQAKAMAGVPTPQQSLMTLVDSAKATVQTSPCPSPSPPPTLQDEGDSDEEFITRFASKLVVTHKARPTASPSVAAPVRTVRPPLTDSQNAYYSNAPDRMPDSYLQPPTTPVSRATQNEDGTMSKQPFGGNQVQHEPFGDEDDLDEIPDINDALAPRFKVHEHHLSPEAIRSRSKRIFTKRADGSKKVSDEIWNDWHAKGKSRRLLEDIFKQCGYDPETWFRSLALFCPSFLGMFLFSLIRVNSCSSILRQSQSYLGDLRV